MRDNTRELLDLLNDGPVRRRDHPKLASSFAWQLRRDTITAVLPGIYLLTEQAKHREQLLAAAMLWHPDTVITGRAAAALQFWPELEAPTIDLAHPKQRRALPEPFRLTERTIPRHWVNGSTGFQCTHPALTALDLCAELGAEVIERALRSRLIKPSHLTNALEEFPQRAGNRARRAILVRSASNPWSAAESEAHQLLRRAGITGWVGNPPLRVRGRLYYPDILFRALRLVVEIDGSQHQTDKDVYENDRVRQNDFSLEHYDILRYSTEAVRTQQALIVAEIRELVADLTANPHFVRRPAPSGGQIVR